MTSTPQSAPHGLPKLGIAVLMTFLLVLGAVLMHALMGHSAESMPGMTSTSTASSEMAVDQHPGTHADAAGHADLAAVSAEAATSTAATATSGVSDCGGLCGMICSLMGMACLMVLVLFAIASLRGRSSRALFVISHALAATPVWARGVIPRRTVSLTALSIIRV